VAKTTPEQPKPANDSTFDNDTQVTSAAHWRPQEAPHRGASDEQRQNSGTKRDHPR
jgi:hypothetical protein